MFRMLERIRQKIECLTNKAADVLLGKDQKNGGKINTDIINPVPALLPCFKLAFWILDKFAKTRRLAYALVLDKAPKWETKLLRFRLMPVWLFVALHGWDTQVKALARDTLKAKTEAKAIELHQRFNAHWLNFISPQFEQSYWVYHQEQQKEISLPEDMGTYYDLRPQVRTGWEGAGRKQTRLQGEVKNIFAVEEIDTYYDLRPNLNQKPREVKDKKTTIKSVVKRILRLFFGRSGMVLGIDAMAQVSTNVPSRPLIAYVNSGDPRLMVPRQSYQWI